MTDKSKHANSSIIHGYCPACKNRSLTYPKNPEYGGLVCRHQGCDWKNVYYIGKSIPKSKMRGSSSSSSRSESNNNILIDLTTKSKEVWDNRIAAQEEMLEERKKFKDKIS